jgi:hypothetical protein
MFACVCSFVSRKRIHQFAPDVACLFLENGKRTQEGRTLEKCPSSFPGAYVSCSSEIKHDK